MPNYKNTLIMTTDVNYIDLTSDLRNINLAVYTSADGYEDSDYSDTINTEGFYTVNIFDSHSSALKLRVELWRPTTQVALTNNSGTCKVSFRADDNDLVIYQWFDDIGMNGLKNQTGSVVISLGVNSIVINDNTNYYTAYETVSDTFTIMFFRSTAEQNRMDKTKFLTSIIQTSGTLRESTSIINPQFNFYYVGVPTFNYCYIPNFGRYYFIDDIISLRNNMWSISLRVDVLMSYREDIKKCEAFIDRNEFEYNSLIVDNMIPLQMNQTITTEFVTNELFGETTTVDYIIQGLNLGRIVKPQTENGGGDERSE